MKNSQLQSEYEQWDETLPWTEPKEGVTESSLFAMEADIIG